MNIKWEKCGEKATFHAIPELTERLEEATLHLILHDVSECFKLTMLANNHSILCTYVARKCEIDCAGYHYVAEDFM